MYDGLLMTKKNSIFHMLRYCIFVGMVSGFAVSIYTLLVEIASHYSREIYALVHEHAGYIALVAAIIIISYFICTYIVKLSNVSRGSGVPQAIGILRGAFIMKWARGLIVMLVCSVVGTFAGLSLGSEGPAMIIGGLAAMGVSKLMPMYCRNYMVTGGVSAGLAVAFNAPLSGMMITLEEGHKRISPVIAFNSIVVIFVALLTSYFILGYRTIVPVSDFKMAWIDLPCLLLFGIIIAPCGILFNFLLLNFRKFFKKWKLKKLDIRFLAPFVLAMILGIFLPDVIGGGAPLIGKLLNDSPSLKMLLLLVVVKMLYTIICTSSGIPGGIFVPMLAVGALVGAMYANILGLVLPINTELYIVAGMVAYFTAVSHGYATALILAIELTHNPFYVLPAIVVCTVTKVIVTVLKTHGLYDTLLNLTIKDNTTKEDEPEVFKAIVQKNSFADGRMVKDLILPTGTSLLDCNGHPKTKENVNLALQAYDIMTFKIESLDNYYAKHVIMSLLTAKNKDDELDGTHPDLVL